MADLAMWLALFNTIGVEWHLSLLGSTLGASVQSTIPFSLPLRLWAHVKVKPPPAWVSETLQRAEHLLNMKYMGENNSLLLKLLKVWGYLLPQHNLLCLTIISPTRISGCCKSQKTLLHQPFNLRTWCCPRVHFLLFYVFGGSIGASSLAVPLEGMQDRRMSTDREPNPEVKVQLLHYLALWPWANQLINQSLSLIC